MPGPVTAMTASGRVAAMPADHGSFSLLAEVSTSAVLDIDDLLRADLSTLQARARQIRDGIHGNRVTFSPKVFITLTMLCRDRCGYCTLAKAPASGETPYLSIGDV